MVHLTRLLAGCCTGLLVCVAVAAAPLVRTSADAQQLAAARGKTKAPPAKGPEQSARAPFTAADAAVAVIPGIPDARAWGDSETDFARLLPTAGGPWLAISGGGADGAYGGGVLAGWSAAGNRPEFAVVTGASIGALIAPYAFLGPSHDEDIHKSFTGTAAADIFEDRVTRDSLLDNWPLRRQIEQRVTVALLAEIAAEHARGRRLLIATTNLDTGRRVIWNMGAIAARGEKGLKLFHDVLVASAAIPGFFSPVGIEVEANGKRFEELQSDGTITAPFFVVPDSMLSSASKSRLPFGELYVLVNARLAPEFSIPDHSVSGVLGRSISVALTAALRAELVLTFVGARRQGVDLRIAHLDPKFEFPAHGVFDGKYMQALYEFGVAAGRKGTAFSAALPDLSTQGASSTTP
jgi:Patatin-like phospholipase